MIIVDDQHKNDKQNQKIKGKTMSLKKKKLMYEMLPTSNKQILQIDVMLKGIL